MKSKEAYDKLKQSDSEESFNTALTEIIGAFCLDVNNLITSRHAKSHSAIRSIVSEVNNKWHALVVLTQKNNDIFFGFKLNDNGFYLCLTEEHPELKVFFEPEIKKGKAMIATAKHLEEEVNALNAEQQKRIDNMYIHQVMPLNEVTEENICHELLCLMAAVGSYFTAGIPADSLRNLCYRIGLLEHWRANGINYDEIPIFEADKHGFISAHKNAIA